MFGIESAFTGRIGRDPELKMVKNGTMAMLMMSVLVDEAPPKEGQEAKPTWVNAKLFGDKAQAASESLKKGDSVYLEGRLTLDEWQGRQGEARHGLSLLPWHWARSAAASLRGNVNHQGQRQSSGAPHHDRPASGQHQRAATSQAPLDRAMDQDLPW